jgi:hypothetical protein
MTDIEQALAEALHSGVLMRAIAPGDTVKTNTPGISVDGAEVRRRLVEGMLATEPMQAIARDAAVGRAVLAKDKRVHAAIAGAIHARYARGLLYFPKDDDGSEELFLADAALAAIAAALEAPTDD